MATRENQVFDLVIIGGGITGTSLAYQFNRLISPSTSVAVIDPRKKGLYLSGTNTLDQPRRSKIGVGLGINTLEYLQSLLAGVPEGESHQPSYEQAKRFLQLSRNGAKLLSSYADALGEDLLRKNGSILFYGTESTGLETTEQCLIN